MRKKNILLFILFIDTVISVFATLVVYLICQEYSIDIPPISFLILFIIVFFIVFVSMKIGYSLGYLDGEIG